RASADRLHEKNNHRGVPLRHRAEDIRRAGRVQLYPGHLDAGESEELPAQQPRSAGRRKPGGHAAGRGWSRTGHGDLLRRQPAAGLRQGIVLLYTKDHTWVLAEGGRAKVGISDFAQAELGDIAYVELPA